MLPHLNYLGGREGGREGAWHLRAAGRLGRGGGAAGRDGGRTRYVSHQEGDHQYWMNFREKLRL